MTYTLKEADHEYMESKLKKDMGKLKYPSVFSKPVSISKVNMPVVRQWIESRLQEELPEDDLIADIVFEMLNAAESPDIKQIHLQLHEMLQEPAAMKFCKTLWLMLLTAQDDADGIPTQLLQQRQAELDKLKQQEANSKQKTNYNRSMDHRPMIREPDARDRDPAPEPKSYKERDTTRKYRGVSGGASRGTSRGTNRGTNRGLYRGAYRGSNRGTFYRKDHQD